MGDTSNSGATSAPSVQVPSNGNGGGASTSGIIDSMEQQVLTFTDTTEAVTTVIPHAEMTLNQHIVEGKSPLGQFLSRPVKIANYTWSTADDLDAFYNIQPFHLFFDNANIKYKLHNWAFMKCNLKVRIVYNASPFYFGTWMFSWLPMFGTNYEIDYVLNDDHTSRIPMSQLEKILICPQTHQAAEMTLPFLWHKDFISVRDNQDFKDLGTLMGRNLAPLASANAEAGEVTLSIYAWAENVVLYGSTSDLAVQGSDEYIDGPISKPATAIANAASMLGSIPIIGPFATATAIGASAVARIAKLFGYTNVPVIADQHAVQTRDIPFMSVVDTGFPTEKLTLDNKNELSIDSRLCGLDGKDELAIAHLAQKESYLTQFSWTNTDAEDDLLWNTAVRPQLFLSDADTQFHINMVPMCWLATMFSFWRGDIIFRLKMNCSAFHKGRLRVTFDPTGNASTTADTQMTCYTEILDVSPQSDVEIRIPYQQFVSWSKTKLATALTASDLKYGTAATNFHTDEYTNGTFSIRVQTALTAPIAAAEVQVLVFVRGAENLEFAAPSSNNYRQVIFGGDLQGSVQMITTDPHESSANPVQITLGERASPLSELYLSYMGENIVSLRPLLRRYAYLLGHKFGTVAADSSWIDIMQLYRHPPRFGYATDGMSAAASLLGGAQAKFNWCQPTPINTISPCFLGNRGAVNYIIVQEITGTSGQSITAFRSDVHTTIGFDFASTAVANTLGVKDKFLYTALLATSGGAAANNKLSKNLNISVPFYANKKFAPNSLEAGCTLAANEDIKPDGFRVELMGDGTNAYYTPLIKVFTAAGTDYDLIKFLYVPTMTVLTTLPTAL
jgi:hypothetical protein